MVTLIAFLLTKILTFKKRDKEDTEYNNTYSNSNNDR